MKLWNYIFISVLLALLFSFAGIPVGGTLLGYIGVSATDFTLDNSTFWITITTLLAAGVGAGIAIGFITKAQSENYVVLPFISVGALTFFVSFAGIIGAASDIGGWVFKITLLILAPLMVGFALALMDYFRGTD